ncbi:MAG: hypothetical protein J7J72_02490 [Bacteroidales bacterium]|nr:hypothetical protein [Bacteroidales bacterium]
MKNLDLNQMESIQGGWSWERCAVGAGTSVLAGGWVAAAAGGWLGVGILAGIGCVVQGMD